MLVSDAMNLEAEFLIARREGLFLQPASAASVASLMEGAERPGKPEADEVIVCIGTGTGKNAAEVAGEALRQAGAYPTGYRYVQESTRILARERRLRHWVKRMPFSRNRRNIPPSGKFTKGNHSVPQRT